jgi:hypothetical protein
MWAQLGTLGVGSSTRDFERWLKGALEVECLTLFGSFVIGTWRDGSLAGDPEGYIEKAPEIGISSHRGPVGEPVRGLVYQRLI